MFILHYDIIIEQISKLNPSINLNWLDLGCGKGKLIKRIKEFNPKLYLGLDIDINCLIKCLKYHDELPDMYLFNKCDLGHDWNETSGQWFSYYNIKYDYIIANFSLMHFFTDLFWEQLNNVVSIGTKFIFNLVSKPLNIIEWSESNSFLKIEDDCVTYKFEWIHDEIKTEPFISEEKLMIQLNKSNWKVVNKFSTDSKHELSKFYTWWIIEKL
jgi:SAM-dependent methyltransferase